ncbi:MAG: ABC transporter ATP-binding protein [Planctomycetaceae bacterium]|nr:ABC transporter ATP-binding protein [Planctomycetaceae bacterium]
MNIRSTANRTDDQRSGPPGLLTLLLPGLRLQPGRIAIAVGCLLGSVVLRIVEPWPLRFVIDLFTAANGNPDGTIVLSDMRGLSVPEVITLAAVSLVVIASLRALADFHRTLQFSIAGNRVVTDLRARVYEHIQELSPSFHQRARGGDLTLRLIGDLNMMKDVAVSAALPLLFSCLLLIGMSGVMLVMNWRLGLIVLCVFPAFWLIALRGSRRIHQSAGKQRRREGALAATAAEVLSAVQSVQAMDIGKAFSGHFKANNADSHREGVRTSRLTAGLERSVDVMIAVASAVVLWQASHLVLSGQLTPGELIVFLSYLKRGFKPLQDFAKYTGRLSKAMAAADRIGDLMAEQPEVTNAPDATQAPKLCGEIRFEHVTFSYAAGTPVISDLSLTIPSGMHLAVVGPSGVGKSTLLNLLLRLYDPERGRVLIDQCDIRNWTLASLRQQMSIVLQDNVVFAATVRDNIAIAAADATDEQVQEAARIAMADAFIRSLPDGYETELGERGVNLSQGQRQRLAIARAALRQSPILLLDEPTSSLDPVHREKVAAALRQATEGRTSIVITHDMQLAGQCDQILFMNVDGDTDLGTHEELLSRCEGYAQACRHEFVVDNRVELTPSVT